MADDGPLQPAADAVITELPLHPAAQVTCPDALLILFPPEMLVASRLYEILVLLVAVAVNVVVPAPWHREEVPPLNTGVLTVGVMVTV